MKWTLLSLIFLVNCAPKYEHRVADSRADILKISAEPNGDKYDHTTVYRMFVINNPQSYWEANAIHTELKVSDHAELLIHQPEYRVETGDGWSGWRAESDWESPTFYTILLPSCASFRDTQKYVIKESAGSSNLLFGLVYSSSQSSKDYQIRDEVLVMPCLRKG